MRTLFAKLGASSSVSRECESRDRWLSLSSSSSNPPPGATAAPSPLMASVILVSTYINKIKVLHNIERKIKGRVSAKFKSISTSHIAEKTNNQTKKSTYMFCSSERVDSLGPGARLLSCHLGKFEHSPLSQWVIGLHTLQQPLCTLMQPQLKERRKQKNRQIS